MSENEAGALLERWPGYNEQSWSERFAELDRIHNVALERMAKMMVVGIEREGKLAVLESERAALAERVEKLEGYLRAWMDAVTNNGTNPDNMLSINHDVIRAMVSATRHLALSSVPGERRQA